jgi:hypothetical protein
VAKLHDFERSTRFAFLSLRFAARLTRANEIAHRIRHNGIEKAFNLTLDERTDTFFAAWDAWSFAQTLEKIEVFHRS